MLIFLLLSFLSFGIYLFLAAYSLRLGSDLPLNRIFFAVCINFMLWSFNSLTSFSVLHTRESALLFYRIFSINWTIFAGLELHFFLILTKKEKILDSWWIYPVLYFPGIFFYFTSNFITFKDIVNFEGQWRAVYYDMPLFTYGYILYYVSYTAIGIILTFQWGIKSKKSNEKYQAKIILVTLFTALILGFTTDTALPILKINFPSVGIITTTICALGIWYAIDRYHLMNLTPLIAIDKILLKMKDLILLMDEDGFIIKANSAIENLIGYRPEELLGCSFYKIFSEKSHKHLQSIITNRPENSSMKSELTAKTGEKIPFDITISSIEYNKGYDTGFMMIAHDIRPEIEIMESYKRFQDMSDLLPNIIMETDNDLMITYINKAGYDALEIKNHDRNKPYYLLDFVHRDDWDRAKDNIKRLMEGKKIGLKEYRCINNSNRLIYLLINSSVIYKEGKAAGISISAVDINPLLISTLLPDDTFYNEFYLTPREKEIFLQLIKGYKNDEIRNVLNISENTLKSHISSIYQTLGISRREEIFYVILNFYNKSHEKNYFFISLIQECLK